MNSSSSSLTCKAYKREAFKLEDRPPLLTNKEISFIESIVNHSGKGPKAETPRATYEPETEAVIMYEFIGKLFVFYATYNVCLISLSFVFVL